MYIRAESAEEAFEKILWNLETRGITSAPRGLKIKELINCCIEIRNPRNRIVSCPERKVNMSYAFGELCWYLSGRNDLEMMEYYSKFMANGTDDGRTLNSAYGYRIFTGKHPLIPFDQWENVKRLLKEDKDSRQAIIHLHTPNNKKTNDEVCTLTLQFLIRNGKLDMITNMRSNDVVLGFTYDVFSFTMLQEMLANELGVKLGTYYHNAGSMHIYENRFYLLDGVTNTHITPMKRFKYGVNDFKEEMIGFEASMRDVYKHMALEKGKLLDEEIYIIIDALRSGLKKTEDELMLFARTAFCLKFLKKMEIKNEESYKFRDEIIQNIREINEPYADVLGYEGMYDRENEKIIIEGIDGAGKTTLANELKRSNSKMQVQHYCKPSDNFRYYYNYSLNIKSNISTIFDRFFISEMVYKKIFNRDCKINRDQISDLLYRLKMNRSTKFIFIIAQNEEELEIVKNRLSEEDLNMEDNLKDMNKEYLRLANILNEMGFDVEIRGIK